MILSRLKPPNLFLRRIPKIRAINSSFLRFNSESYSDQEKGISECDGYIHIDGGPLTIPVPGSPEVARVRLVGKLFVGYPEILWPGKALDSFWRQPDSPIMGRMYRWLDRNYPASGASDRFAIRHKLPLWTNCAFPLIPEPAESEDDDIDEGLESAIGAHWKWALITRILGNLINTEIIHSVGPPSNKKRVDPADVDLGPICDFVGGTLQEIFSGKLSLAPEVQVVCGEVSELEEAHRRLKNMDLGYLWPEFHSIFHMSQTFKNGLYDQNKIDEAGLQVFSHVVREFWNQVKEEHGKIQESRKKTSRNLVLSAAHRLPLNLRDLHYTMGVGCFPELMTLLHSQYHVENPDSHLHHHPPVEIGALEVENARKNERIQRLRILASTIIRNTHYIFNVRQDFKHAEEVGNPIVLNSLEGRCPDFRSALHFAIKEHEEAVREFRDIYFGFRRTCPIHEMPMILVQNLADVTSGSSVHFHTLSELFNVLERFSEPRSVDSKFVFKFE